MAELLQMQTGEMGATQDLVLARDPEAVLEEAMRAAKALQKVISGKAKPVKFNGEIYLEFEDWQTCGRFYGITAKIETTSLIQLPDGTRGYEAHAVAIYTPTGQVVSAADAMCLNDEDKWSSRAKYEWVNGTRTKMGMEPVPLFQLRSMAQTRACAKALRNVLSWVVVLAGYRPTPAEEMPEDARDPDGKADAKKKDDKPAFISPAQKSELAEVAKQAGWTGAALQAFVKENYGGWPKMPAADFDTVKQKLADGIDTGQPTAESNAEAAAAISAITGVTLPEPAKGELSSDEIF
jgi:hypothetical protein